MTCGCLVVSVWQCLHSRAVVWRACNGDSLPLAVSFTQGLSLQLGSFVSNLRWEIPERGEGVESTAGNMKHSLAGSCIICKRHAAFHPAWWTSCETLTHISHSLRHNSARVQLLTLSIVSQRAKSRSIRHGVSRSIRQCLQSVCLGHITYGDVAARWHLNYVCVVLL